MSRRNKPFEKCLQRTFTLMWAHKMVKEHLKGTLATTLSWFQLDIREQRPEVSQAGSSSPARNPDRAMGIGWQAAK